MTFECNLKVGEVEEEQEEGNEKVVNKSYQIKTDTMQSGLARDAKEI